MKYFIHCIFLLVILACNSNSEISQLDKLGKESIEKNNLDSAQFYFERLLQLDSNNLKAINQLADLHFRKVEIGKSLKYFIKSIKLDSMQTEVHFKMAEIKLFLGDYKNVFKAVNKGLRINDRAPQAYFMKGVAYKHIGDTVKAISSFKTSLELDHDFSQVYYELGLLLTLKKDSLAIEYYKNGVKLKPNDPGLLSSLAWAYNKFEQFSLAENTYKEMVKRFPIYIAGKSNYASFKYQRGELDSSLILCNEILKIDSNDYSTLNLKGIVLTKKGDEEGAGRVKLKLSSIDSELDL